MLRRDGRLLTQNPLPALTIETEGEGTYRVEVYLSTGPGDPPIPWIVSNPIYVRPPGWGIPSPRATETASITRGIQGGPWHVEKDDESSANIAQKDYPTGPVHFEFRLADGGRVPALLGARVALSSASERTHLSSADTLAAHARSVQPSSAIVNRWRRSIYPMPTARCDYSI